MKCRQNDRIVRLFVGSYVHPWTCLLFSFTLISYDLDICLFINSFLGVCFFKLNSIRMHWTEWVSVLRVISRIRTSFSSLGPSAVKTEISLKITQKLIQKIQIGEYQCNSHDEKKAPTIDGLMVHFRSPSVHAQFRAWVSSFIKWAKL